MNCKPGDLAVVVRAKQDPAWIGRILTIVEWSDLVGGWVTRPMPEGYQAVADYCLRPIRDPGDDAVDETLLRQPAPTLEAA